MRAVVSGQVQRTGIGKFRQYGNSVPHEVIESVIERDRYAPFRKCIILQASQSLAERENVGPPMSQTLQTPPKELRSDVEVRMPLVLVIERQSVIAKY